MKILREIALVLAILLMGNVLNRVTGIPIPGNVLGMIILLTLLLSGVLKVERVENISKFLLDHLAFLFVPPGVALLNSIELLGDAWIEIIVITVFTTATVVVATGLTVQTLIERQK